MFRSPFNLLKSLLIVVVLTACSSPPPPPVSSPSAPPTANPTVAPPKSEATAADPQKVLGQMQEILSKTQAAVKANDFAKAQETYKDFDDGYWSKIEDGVKAKSKQSYEQIEDGMNSVSNNLKATKPDQAKTIAAIESFTKTLNAYQSSLK